MHAGCCADPFGVSKAADILDVDQEYTILFLISTKKLI